jgi:uroporphyrinogen-III synthase
MVTRPASEAEETRRRLAGSGHEVLVEPMLTIALRAGPLPAGPFDALIVTSGNALAALAARPAAEAAALRRLPLVAVGRRTAALAKTLGHADIVTAGRDVAGLADHVARHWHRPHRALYLAGADRSGDLGALLGPLGHRVELAIVYDAIKTRTFSAAARQALLAGEVEAVLHYSARTAEAFVDCMAASGLAGRIAARQLCLSRKVAEVLVAAELGPIATAERPDEDTLLALLAA